MMKHPDKIFPRRKEAEFDESGRPFHPLFYTVQPNFYQTLSDMVAKLRALDVHEDKMIREGKHFVDKKEFLIGEDWITADKLSMMLVEKLNDFHRAQFVKTIERLTNHNYGYLEKDYINGFRRVVASQFEALEAPDLMYNSEGRPFMTSYGRRKSCWSRANCSWKWGRKICHKWSGFSRYVSKIARSRAAAFSSAIYGFYEQS
ncbi:small ribosomal subunit protein uS9m-like [Artemia franciscana]|uniref:small ribosomal subunit protein uS9m-like n=1 Tax=Artemia franciscana TaxID=6661 RepID=UPI0032D9F0DD